MHAAAKGLIKNRFGSQLRVIHGLIGVYYMQDKGKCVSPASCRPLTERNKGRHEGGTARSQQVCNDVDPQVRYTQVRRSARNEAS